MGAPEVSERRALHRCRVGPRRLERLVARCRSILMSVYAVCKSAFLPDAATKPAAPEVPPEQADPCQSVSVSVSE